MWMDTLIGSTTIDLEDRLIGEPDSKQLIAYEALKTKFEDELKEKEKDNEEDEVKDRKRNEIAKVSANIESM